MNGAPFVSLRLPIFKIASIQKKINSSPRQSWGLKHQKQSSSKETGTGQISYTTHKTNETCFVPIFEQTLQVFDRLLKDKNLPPLLQRLRAEDNVTDYIKQHQQRRKTVEDIIKVIPAESLQSIIDEYRKTGNAAKLLKKSRSFVYFQRNGYYNEHIKKYFQDLVKRGVLED